MPFSSFTNKIHNQPVSLYEKSWASKHLLSNISGISLIGDNREAKRDLKEVRESNEVEQTPFCTPVSRWMDHVINIKTSTSLEFWNFETFVSCPKLDITKYPKARHKVSLQCDEEPRLATSVTTMTSNVYEIPFGDKCLVDVIDNCCKGDSDVPNVVHFIWYSKRELGFFQFISFMSALRFMKPCLFLLHGDYLPYGKYWDYFISISPNIIHVKRTRPDTVFGKKLAFEEHASDIMRIEALKSKYAIWVSSFKFSTYRIFVVPFLNRHG